MAGGCNEHNTGSSSGDGMGIGGYTGNCSSCDESRGSCGTDRGGCGAVASRVPGAKGTRRKVEGCYMGVIFSWMAPCQ